jgi:16S rRNA G966 N2-methylase RsmD
LSGLEHEGLLVSGICSTKGMESAPDPPSDGAHTIFAEQMAIYRRVVEADYMSHRALFGILHDLLKQRPKAFSFLDLASGDASRSVGALSGTKVSDYTAVDLSEPALRLASQNARLLACDTQLVLQDFQDYLDPPPRIWDVIFIGFSYHHLIGDAKLAFARKLRRAVSARGEWIFFEPMLQGDQTRAGYLERWKRSLDEDWEAFNPEEKTTIWEHVSNYDFPERRESFEQIALEAGFRAFEHLYTDPFGFYGAFRAIA